MHTPPLIHENQPDSLWQGQGCIVAHALKCSFVEVELLAVPRQESGALLVAVSDMVVSVVMAGPRRRLVVSSLMKVYKLVVFALALPESLEKKGRNSIKSIELTVFLSSLTALVKRVFSRLLKVSQSLRTTLAVAVTQGDSVGFDL